jgi:hypothetical protein
MGTRNRDGLELNFELTLGSPTARPSIRCSSSCSTARTEAPPPLETLEAISRVSFLTTSLSIAGRIDDSNHSLTSGMYVDVPDCR